MDDAFAKILIALFFFLLFLVALGVTGAYAGFNRYLWIRSKFGKYALPREVFSRETYIGDQVKMGLDPLTGYLSIGLLLGLLCLLVAYFFSISTLYRVGLWLIAIPFIGMGLGVGGYILRRSFGNAEARKENELKERDERIELISKNIGDNDNDDSPLGVFRHFWRANYRMDFVQDAFNEEKGKLNEDLLKQIEDDFNYVSTHVSTVDLSGEVKLRQAELTDWVEQLKKRSF